MNANVEAAAAPQVKAQKTRASAKANEFQVTGHKSPKSKTPAQKTSKQDLVVAMLRRKEGATVAAIMKATGWQKHSVHGFFAGVVRKNLKLNLVRSGEGEQATYRITSSKTQIPATKYGQAILPRKAARPLQKSARKRAR